MNMSKMNVVMNDIRKKFEGTHETLDIIGDYIEEKYKLAWIDIGEEEYLYHSRFVRPIIYKNITIDIYYDNVYYEKSDEYHKDIIKIVLNY